MCQVWQYIPVITILRRLGQEGQELDAGQNYIERFFFFIFTKFNIKLENFLLLKMRATLLNSLSAS